MESGEWECRVWSAIQFPRSSLLCQFGAKITLSKTGVPSPGFGVIRGSIVVALRKTMAIVSYGSGAYLNTLADKELGGFCTRSFGRG